MNRDRHARTDEGRHDMICAVAGRTVLVPPSVVPGEHIVERVHEVRITASSGFHNGQTRRCVGNEHRQEAIPALGGELGSLGGYVHRPALVAGVDRDRGGIHTMKPNAAPQRMVNMKNMDRATPATEFDRFRVLSFDCYGTLIDWEPGIRMALRRWAARRHVTVGDDELLELFATFENRIERETHPAPLYPAVLAETLHRIGATVGAEVDESDAAAFGASVGDWPAFADSIDALHRLQQKYRLIIVSNIDRASFAASNRRLGVAFDRIITAEDVGAYKPDEPHFRALLAQIEAWGLQQNQLLHVAQSLFHDHEPARRLGLATVWIDRRRDRDGYGATPPPEDGSITPTWQFPSMATFAEAANPIFSPG